MQYAEHGDDFRWFDMELGAEEAPHPEHTQSFLYMREKSMLEATPCNGDEPILARKLYKISPDHLAGHLSGQGVAYYPGVRKRFDAMFLPDVEEGESFSPFSYAVETLRQRSAMFADYDPVGGSGEFRGRASQNSNFTAWATHLCDLYRDTLTRAGVYDAIRGSLHGFTFCTLRIPSVLVPSDQQFPLPTW